MAGFLKIAPLFFLLLLCDKAISAESESTEELEPSESKDGKLEIIKQIKKVNDDGSYTIGYEADDGSFKIESRDVLGNIKGTYGYLDDAGQIKRVSYSTSNSSEILSKPEPTSSVVQRIPKSNRTQTYTTKRPSYSSTTLSTPTSTTALQRIAKLRNSLTSTTTSKPNYSEIVNMESELVKVTERPHIIYPSSTPRILLSRPIVRSTPPTQTQTQKSEGQIIRPEVVTTRPTEIPLFRRLALRHQILNEDKLVTEQPEVRGNILRRQLAPERTNNFDPQQHVFNLQQALGNDATDVYSASVTTGTPRPLFTTTARPRALLSTTTQPTVVSRPTIRYPVNYQRNDLQNLEASTSEYVQETTTTEATVNDATPTSIPVVQIPANRATQEPLVAIKHPFQPGTILVPFSQLQRRVVPLGANEQEPQYVPQEPTQPPKPIPEVEPRPVYVRRLPPPQFRPIPVQVDENGFIREISRPANSQPVSYPVPVAPTLRYVGSSVENDVDDISPPVSTRDFQKLLQQLILRQTRLERISALTDSRRQPEYYQPRYRPIYRPTPGPYYVQRMPESSQTGPVQFISEDAVHTRQGQFVHIAPQQQQVAIRHQQERDPYNQNGQSYAPTRRVARLLQPGQDERQETKEEYLPPDVREMLLLRMLQLAINPALPLSEDEMVEDTTPVPQYKKIPVRNVEILGEEAEEEKRPVRSKRYREPYMDYYKQK